MMPHEHTGKKFADVAIEVIAKQLALKLQSQGKTNGSCDINIANDTWTISASITQAKKRTK